MFRTQNGLPKPEENQRGGKGREIHHCQWFTFRHTPVGVHRHRSS